MSGHGRREQKKLAKKKAKRTGKRGFLARRASTGIAALLHHAGEWPVVEAMVPEGLWDQGLGQLVIARQMPDGGIAFAVFLVDTYCLGVKDAFCNILSRFEYRDFVDKLERVGRLEPVSPESFAKLVTEAVAYARTFGLQPHQDYEDARLLLAGIDPSLSTERFAFGKDGKPFYIQGPHDSPAMMANIAARMKAVGGSFVQVAGGIPDSFEDDEDEPN
jgi:hypothetical protein